MSENTYISFYLRYNTVHVFVNAVREIGRPKFVRFLVNGNEMMMVMQPHYRKEIVSFRVPDSILMNSYGTHDAFQIHSKAFCQVLSGKMGWDSSCSYRIPGKIYPKQQIVRFDLKQAELIQRDVIRQSKHYVTPLNVETDRAQARNNEPSQSNSSEINYTTSDPLFPPYLATNGS